MTSSPTTQITPDAMPGREQTDESLRSERGKTDREFARTRAEVEAQSNAVLAHAQDRADKVLKVARDRADVDGASEEVHDERQLQDRTLAQEREMAASTLDHERDARQRALTELLRYEREETDKDLLTERSGADEAVGTRDAFLGMVAHDVRTFLGGIALDAHLLLLESAGDKKVVKRAESIQRAAARINRLVGDLLDVVSIDAGTLDVAPSESDVGALLREAVDAVSLAAAAKKVAVRVASPPQLLARFDYGRMLQVMANLLGNAVKFTPAGGVVEACAALEGGEVHVAVADNGAGIPRDQLQSVFERFHQLDRRDRRGHGLGLWISKSIVLAHAGRLWVESAGLGAGSTFHVTFPASPPGGPSAAAAAPGP